MKKDDGVLRPEPPFHGMDTEGPAHTTPANRFRLLHNLRHTIDWELVVRPGLERLSATPLPGAVDGMFEASDVGFRQDGIVNNGPEMPWILFFVGAGTQSVTPILSKTLGEYDITHSAPLPGTVFAGSLEQPVFMDSARPIRAHDLVWCLYNDGLRYATTEAPAYPLMDVQEAFADLAPPTSSEKFSASERPGGGLWTTGQVRSVGNALLVDICEFDSGTGFSAPVAAPTVGNITGFYKPGVHGYDAAGNLYVACSFAGNGSYDATLTPTNMLEPFIMVRDAGGAWSEIALPTGPAGGVGRPERQRNDAYYFTDAVQFGTALYVSGIRARWYYDAAYLGGSFYSRAVGFIAKCEAGAFTIVREFAAGATYPELGPYDPVELPDFCTLWYASCPSVTRMFVADGKLYYVWGSAPYSGLPGNMGGFSSLNFPTQLDLTYYQGLFYGDEAFDAAAASLGLCSPPALSFPYAVQYLGSTVDGAVFSDRVLLLASAEADEKLFLCYGATKFQDKYVFFFEVYNTADNTVELSAYSSPDLLGTLTKRRVVSAPTGYGGGTSQSGRGPFHNATMVSME